MSRLLGLLAALFVLAPGVFASTADAAQIFSVDCEFSHKSFDDPIVYPGQLGSAHSHEFTGAWSTDAFSTTSSLSNSGTSCLTNSADKPLADKSAYWSPTLYQNGVPVPLKSMALYVDLGVKNNAAQIAALQPFPPGLKMIADISNSYQWEGGGWGCGGEDNKVLGITPGSEIVPCPSGVQSLIVFPDCWDGVNLDSPDHRSHMAYPPSGQSNCPASHPVYLPRLEVKHVFDTTGEGGGFTVASGSAGQPNTTGSTGSFHSDFMNAWDQAELAYLVQYCLKDGMAVSNTRPCLGPQMTQAEIEVLEAQRTNPNSPAPTPAGTLNPPAPTYAWSYGAVTLNGIDQQVAIPDVLLTDATYSLQTTYTGSGTVLADRNVMMLGNTSRNQARIYVNGTTAKAQIISAGKKSALASVRFTPNQPHRFVLVRDGRVSRFYMDGILVGTHTFASDVLAHDLGPGALGAYRDADRFSSRAAGSYDKTRVYAYALTAAEAAAP